MLTLQLLEATTAHPTGRENDGSDDYSLVYAPGSFEKDNPSDHALRVWISETGDEYHLWIPEDFDGDRRGVEQYFVREGLTSVDDALKSLHEDIEGYLEILS